MTGHRAVTLAGLGVLYLLWGSTYFPIHVVLEVAPPLGASALRFVAAGAVLLAGARAAGERLPNREEWLSAGVLGALYFVGGNAGVVLSQTRVTSGVAALLVGMMPMWVVVLEAIAGHAPSPRGVAGVLLGAAGVAWLVGIDGQVADAYGFATLLVSAVSWAGGTVLSRRVPLAGPFAGAGAQMGAGGVLLGVLSVLAGETGRWSTAWEARHVGALAWLLVGGSVLGFTLFTWLLRRAGPAVTTTYAFVNPVIAVLIGWALGGEPVSPRVVGAGLLIVVAVAAIVSGARSERSGG